MKKNGFTLVELIAVIVILGLIVTLVATNFFGGSDHSRKKLDEIMQNQLKDAIRVYAVDKNLKDCHNCTTPRLNTNCVPENADKEIERQACAALGIEVTLGMLKVGDYFTDTANHCQKLDGSNKKIDDNDVVLKMYRFEGEEFIDLNGVSCRK